MIATKEAACRHKLSSDDPTGLGRWTSMLISGRHGHNVCYVCAYNPCKTTNINGSYLQQISMVATSNSRDTFNPRMTSETPLKYAGKI
jgi:hypothetical protein